jgi:hypothetical protein
MPRQEFTNHAGGRSVRREPEHAGEIKRAVPGADTDAPRSAHQAPSGHPGTGRPPDSECPRKLLGASPPVFRTHPLHLPETQAGVSSHGKLHYSYTLAPQAARHW